jgi:hypothetical protein
MGLLQRMAENEGREAVLNLLLSKEGKMKKQVVVTYQGVTYEIPTPNTISEVDLTIRETYEIANGREPTDQEIEHVFHLLAKASSSSAGE